MNSRAGVLLLLEPLWTSSSATNSRRGSKHTMVSSSDGQVEATWVGEFVFRLLLRLDAGDRSPVDDCVRKQAAD